MERHDGGRLLAFVRSLPKTNTRKGRLFFRYFFMFWKRATAFTIKERIAITSIATS